MALAKKSGVESELLRRDVGATPQGPDASKPLAQKTHRQFQNRPTSEAWQLIERVEAHKAKAEGVSIFYMDPDGHEGITCTVAAEHGKTGPELRGIIEGLTSFFEGGNITLSVGLLRFERGQDFLDWIGKDRIAVEYEKEITQ